MTRKNGFTLVEVIVTISIIAVLATISFLTFSSYIVESRDTKRIVDVESIAAALDVSFKRNGSTYPRPISAVVVSYTGSDNTEKPYALLWFVKDWLVSDFNSIPVDPSTSDYYAYAVTTDRKYYELAATLEQPADDWKTSQIFIPKTYADDAVDYAYVLWNYRYDPAIWHYTKHLIILNTLPTGEKKIPRTSISIGAQTVPDGEITTASGITIILPNGGDVPYPINSKKHISSSADLGDDDFYIEASSDINIKCLTCGAWSTPPPSAAVNWACGTANGQTLADASNITGLWACSAGSLSGTVAGSWPWSWTCNWLNGWNFIMCSAQKTASFSAVGWTITTNGGYTIHTFTSNDTFTVTSWTRNIEVLVVAWGGGGTNLWGGGGAGGVVYNSSLAVSSQSYPVTVGAGGIADNYGENSIFSTITAMGWGKGGGWQTNGYNGGSGGWAGGSTTNVGTKTGGNPETGQGYKGGDNLFSGIYAQNAGGGWAGAAWSDTTSSSVGSSGGDGTNAYSDLLISANAGIDISNIHWIAGGGWGSGSSGWSGGKGGGGEGDNSSQNSMTPGTANTGWGGGAGWNRSGWAGGSGIVIIRYLN